MSMPMDSDVVKTPIEPATNAKLSAANAKRLAGDREAESVRTIKSVATSSPAFPAHPGRAKHNTVRTAIITSATTVSVPPNTTSTTHDAAGIMRQESDAAPSNHTNQER